MPTRKNAKLLTAAEKQNLVRAFVMMKADPVPGRPYNWYDAYVLIHRYIQNINAPAVAGGSPATNNVNFGHHEAAFAPWHRYFLRHFELKLQTYVAGVMLPYWDWTDPAPIMTADFMGPNGSMASNWEVRQGYFAASAPGSGGNLTPLPAWWPAGLTGWTLPAAWGTYSGALRRNIGAAASMPSAASIRSVLDKASYASFRAAVESGTGVVPASAMHDHIHVWFGGSGVSHMQSALRAAFDPMFFLHHANVDRLWAMWQMDGHGNDYPADGAVANHHRLDDPMYPWVGAAAGYAIVNAMMSFPLLPDFAADPVVRAADVMDHRALGYSYDTMVTVGISLDRTGSMLGMTPDPMTAAAPDVTKWEAAKRGVSAFLVDCETAYAANEAYVLAGIKTFRSLAANQFTAVFAGTPYGLVKNGSGYSQASFDAAILAQTPGGGTPLADALSDTFGTLVQAPFGGAPGDERRFLALFTDGMLTSGSPLASIPYGSLTRTAVFAMGFGTGADVDYPTLDSIVAKGAVTYPTPQVLHGENAGQIDKFFSKLLAAALGYAPVMDPVLEMFEGEHVHLDFTATSAEDAFYLTAQGMDFDDEAWSFHLTGPDQAMHYADGSLPTHAHGDGGQGVGHCGCMPYVTARRGKGRLTLFVSRNNCGDAQWIGHWRLMVARRARDLEAMLMIGSGPLLYPVGAGPTRGARYARLLMKPSARTPVRLIAGPTHNELDEPINSTNRFRGACSVVVNVYARTRLRLELAVEGAIAGDRLGIELLADVDGAVDILQSAVRAVSPQVDLRTLLPQQPPHEGKGDPRFDAARALANVERRNPKPFELVDEAAMLVSHESGAWHYHVPKTDIAGAYHFGVLVSGVYRPKGGSAPDRADGGQGHGAHRTAPQPAHGAGHSGDGGSAGHPTPEKGCGPAGERMEYFSRILTASAGLSAKSQA